jgi:hypothetical protein
MVIKNYKIFERGDGVQDDESPSNFIYDEVDLTKMYSEKGYDRTINFLKDMLLQPGCTMFWKGNLVTGVDEYHFFDDKTKNHLQLMFVVDGVQKSVIHPSGSIFIKRLRNKDGQKTEKPWNEVPDKPVTKPPDFIMGVPSGEIIDLNLEQIKLIRDRQLTNWTYSYHGNIVNCYIYNDEDYPQIDKLLKSMKKSDDDIISICKEFQDEMSLIFQNKKRFAIGYFVTNEKYFFYTIIPDLHTNKEFYEDYEKRISEVLIYMRSLYPPHSFSALDKLQNKNAKYYSPQIVKNQHWFDRYSDLL